MTLSNGTGMDKQSSTKRGKAREEHDFSWFINQFDVRIDADLGAVMAAPRKGALLVILLWSAIISIYVAAACLGGLSWKFDLLQAFVTNSPSRPFATLKDAVSYRSRKARHRRLRSRSLSQALYCGKLDSVRHRCNSTYDVGVQRHIKPSISQ